MGIPVDDLAVRVAVTVAASPERAFATFARRMGSWWPLASHHIGDADAADVVIEPRVGGRWFERGVDGSECDWGHVLAWEPPHRIVLVWQLSAQWALDPELATEVEVTFTGTAAGGTVVELEHRGLSAYGEDAVAMRDTFSSPNGWSGMLGAYAAASGG